MNAKQALDLIKQKDDYIEMRTIELQQLKCKVTRITTELKTCPGGSAAGNSDKIGGLVSAIVDLENEIVDLTEDFVKYRQQCIKEILEPVRAENVACYKVLHRRYVQYIMSFKRIASLESYSYDYVRELHSGGLKIAQKFLENSKLPTKSA